MYPWQNEKILYVMLDNGPDNGPMSEDSYLKMAILLWMTSEEGSHPCANLFQSNGESDFHLINIVTIITDNYNQFWPLVIRWQVLKGSLIYSCIAKTYHRLINSLLYLVICCILKKGRRGSEGFKGCQSHNQTRIQLFNSTGVNVQLNKD